MHASHTLQAKRVWDRREFLLGSVNKNIFSEGPLKIFFSDGSLLFESNKKAAISALLLPPILQGKRYWFLLLQCFCFCPFFLRFIPLTLMCDCPAGIAKSPLRGVSRCFPV
jgi:hypothetical protein